MEPAMTHPICETCGTQYDSPTPVPDRCPICCDERQYVGWAGQRWTTMDRLTTDHRVRMEEDGGIPSIGITPAFAIDHRAMLLCTRLYRVMWECLSVVTDD